MVDSTTSIHSAVPVIGTNDIEKTLSYYTDILCFSLDFKYGDSPVYAGVKSGNAEIYFTLDTDFIRVIKENKLNPEIFIWISDANTLFNSQVNRGAEVLEPISDRPWGARQYVIREINGYHLKFAQPIQ